MLNATCSAPANEPESTTTTCTDLAGGASNQAIESFVAESMPAEGALSVRGINFQWPGQTQYYSPVWNSLYNQTPQADTILDGTVPIQLGGAAGYRYVALLTAGFDGDQPAAPYSVTYADGTQQTTPIWLRDWAAPQGASDVLGIRLQQGSDSVNGTPGEGAIQLRAIPVDPTKALRSLSLPGGSVHSLTYAVTLTNTIPTGGGPLDGPPYTVKGDTEASYQATGPWAVTKTTTAAACDSKGSLCDLYAPDPLGTDPRTKKPFLHPVIAWANGSGQTAANYDYYLRHLASWGFLVIASRDTDTGDGTTTADAAKYLLAQAKTPGNPLYGKVDTAHVGTAGHSQGGGSVVSLFAHQTSPFTAYVAIHPAPGYFCYAVCNIHPGDMANGTRGAILYLQSVGDGGAGDTKANYYDQTPNTATRAIGVLANAKHDDIMGNPHCTDATCVTGVYGYLGYSTAWFVWQLEGQSGLARAFGVSDGEFNQPDSDWNLNQSNVPDTGP
jgi:hypothetical protein